MQLPKILLIFIAIYTLVVQDAVDALICYSCTYISLEGSNIPDNRIPGSEDTCLTKEAVTADCDIYSAQYGEVTQCIKYDTLSQIKTATGEIVIATFVRKQCDITGLSTQETDYCISSEESSLTPELDGKELMENLADVIGTIQYIQSDGHVCRCDTDECNAASTARISSFLFVTSTGITALMLLLL